jgi:hypothetical protein
LRVFKPLRSMPLCALSLCFLLFSSSWVYGTIISYSDVSGVNVNYSGISEDPTRSTSPGPDNPLPKFGQPTGGDLLSFLLMQSFNTKSPFGGNADICDSNLRINSISTKNNNTGISTIVFSESGDYELARTINSSSEPLALVKGMGFLLVTAINGHDPGAVIEIKPTFVHEFHLASGDLVDTDTWTGSLVFDVGQALLDNHITGYATAVELSLDNRLTSMSDASSYSDIKKKEVYLNTTTIEAPEPSTFIMLAMAFFGLGIWRRKK